MNQTEIDEAVKLIAELDGKRTQGDWQKLAEWAVEGKIRTICDRVNDSAYIAAAPLMARTVAAQAEKIKRLEAANEKMQQLGAFLLGEEAYMGIHFGNSPAYNGRHRYWWRHDLQKILTELNAAMKE
jgi:UDP-N-acetylglucosamine enolpyruvyl transferase